MLLEAAVSHVNLQIPLGQMGMPPYSVSVILVLSSGSLGCNALYILDGSTLTSAPVSNFTHIKFQFYLSQICINELVHFLLKGPEYISFEEDMLSWRTVSCECFDNFVKFLVVAFRIPLQCFVHLSRLFSHMD